MNVRVSTEEFIQKAQNKHGLARYDYSRTVYTKSRHKITIVCPLHGAFSMTANCHLNGQGCMQCSLQRRAEKLRLSIKEFVLRANKTHNNKYDYSFVIYRTSEEKVHIHCPVHGEFWQTPGNHISGQGCPTCAVVIRHGFSKDRYIRHCVARNCAAKLYLAELSNEVEHFLKIGITCTSIRKRFLAIPYKTQLLCEVENSPDVIWELENTLHTRCEPYKYTPQQYFKGHRECYMYNNLGEITSLWQELTY